MTTCSTRALAPEEAYELAKAVGRKFTLPKAEAIIATSPEWSYKYAVNVLEARFEPGEEAIATDAYHSYCYARFILNGRFFKGEGAIALSDYWTLYTQDVLPG